MNPNRPQRPILPPARTLERYPNPNVDLYSGNQRIPQLAPVNPIRPPASEYPYRYPERKEPEDLKRPYPFRDEGDIHKLHRPVAVKASRDTNYTGGAHYQANPTTSSVPLLKQPLEMKQLPHVKQEPIAVKESVKEPPANATLPAPPVSQVVEPQTDPVDEPTSNLELSEFEKKKRLFQDLLISKKEAVREVDYNSQLAVLTKEIDLLKRGEHPEYKISSQSFEKDWKKEMKEAEIHRDYQVDCIVRLFEMEREALEKEYDEEKAGLQEQMLQALEEMKRRHLDDRDNFELTTTSDINNNEAKKVYRPGIKFEDRRATKKSKNDKGAVVPFLLRDHEIYEDLVSIRKYSSPSSRKSASTGIYKKKLVS